MAKACGKIILFGEHSVVYNKVGIALPVNKFCTEVISHDSEEFSCCGDRVYTDIEKQKLNKLIEYIFLKLSLSKKIHLHIESTVPISSGLGSSASLSVALIREINNYFNLRLSKEKINELAFECEKIFHGNPSGIDNTVISYNKPVFLNKKPEIIKIKKPLYFVIASTGKKPHTQKIVSGLREKYEKNKEKYEEIFEKIKEITIKAKSALENSDIKLIGALMNKNHDLLKKLDVSSSKLNLFCEIALQNKAYGAKMSGAGKGGNMIVLTEKQNMKKLIDELRHLSNQVFYIKVGK